VPPLLPPLELPQGLWTYGYNNNKYYYYIRLMAFSRTTWVSRHQEDKPFYILMKQEMMGWIDISWTIMHLAPDI